MQTYELNLLTDEELIDLIQKGKYNALKKLVVRYADDLFNFAYHFNYDKNKTKLIIEKLFVEIWRQPYLYKKSFKITIYKRLINKLIKQKLNSNIKLQNKNLLNFFKKKDILVINLYYFGILKSEELNKIYKNIQITIKKIEKNFLNKNNIELFDFIHKINYDIQIPFNFYKDIIDKATKYTKKDKYLPIIIFFSLLPLITLLATFIYSNFFN